MELQPYYERFLITKSFSSLFENITEVFTIWKMKRSKLSLKRNYFEILFEQVTKFTSHAKIYFVKLNAKEFVKVFQNSMTCCYEQFS